MTPRHGWAHVPTQRTATIEGGCVSECVRACTFVRVCALPACVRACVRDVFAIYDNNILPRLIMIIIKIIFLYKYIIEIAHTDDFSSTGLRLVIIIIAIIIIVIIAIIIIMAGMAVV